MATLLSEIAETSRRLAETSSRSAKIGLLADQLRRLAPAELDIGVGYLVGRLAQGRIGVGFSAIGQARRVSPAERPELTLAEVDASFGRIAGTTGAGSAERRRSLVAGLFSRATAAEQDFLVRLALGELRQGALEGLMVDAVARAFEIAPHEIRRAAMLSGDLVEVARAAAAGGQPALAGFRLELLKPVSPMLAQTASDLEGALAQLGRSALEFKLDGARVQAHKAGDEVRVYSRSLRDVTAAVPEVVEAVRGLPVRELIADGEVVALGPSGRPRTFQETMRRFGRKLDVSRLSTELPLAPYFFDCLHLEGEDWIDRPAEERFSALERAAPDRIRVPRLLTDSPADARAFLDQSIERGHEGLMIKSLGAPYEAGNRGSAWLKFKPAHTLDLVVLAVEWGSGRRQGWLSNLHLGARDPATGELVMLGKTFKGMTDEMLAWQTQRLQELAVARDGHVVHVRPELVVEIAFDDIQRSPHYPGGLALRFARVKRYRPDKAAADADTIDAVRAIHAAQAARRA